MPILLPKLSERFFDHRSGLMVQSLHVAFEPVQTRARQALKLDSAVSLQSLSRHATFLPLPRVHDSLAFSAGGRHVGHFREKSYSTDLPATITIRFEYTNPVPRQVEQIGLFGGSKRL